MSEDLDLQQVLAFKVKDEDLSFLNGMVNRAGLGIGITLFVKGSVISGSLIAGRKYYQLVSDNLKSSGTIGEALSTYFETKGKDGYTSDDPNFEYPNNFLHLENIKVRCDNGQMGSLNNAMLRIKIDEVDGHLIGTAE
ncbi:gas vesicle protein [Raoultella terrigena]|uniref:gas vesicle protein n=1 Tax=Raoultella terrigena TaxID=577 RepID=UPI000976008A|nr:gas vesicle protein [Raoultella terrigena]OMP89783.1 gas vesicle protein [Raoultella terrigena]